MTDVREGRARRLFSVGALSSAIGGRYLWELVRRPFRTPDDARKALLDAHVRNAERLIAGSTELRGAFTKLVQMLSMRGDVLPAEAIDVLAAARSAVPPMPFERVRTVIESELGAPIERLFAGIEPEAVAAASLGQVHRATLLGGTPVAVKVQYPDIGRTVAQDVKNVKALLRIVARIGRDVMRQEVDTAAVAAELETRLLEELDYEQEARSAERFRLLLSDDPEVVIPVVHPTHSSRRVLTMDWADGYPLEHVMSAGMDQVTRDWVAEKLFRLFFRQLLEFGLVQTDPHPGNYKVTHHPRLVMLDFGSVRALEPPILAGYRQLARGVADGDDRTMGDAGRALGFVRSDATVFVRIMRLAGEPLMVDATFDPRTYDVVARATAAAEIEMENGLLLAPGHHVMLSRALLGLDGYLKTLGAVRNWHRVFREIVAAIPADAPAP